MALNSEENARVERLIEALSRKIRAEADVVCRAKDIKIHATPKGSNFQIGLNASI